MLYFVIWFSVLSGLAVIAFLRMKGIAGGGTVYLRCHAMWMSPVANVAVSIVFGLVALPVLMRVSRPTAVRIGFIVLASLFFFSVLILKSALLSRIHFWAKVIRHSRYVIFQMAEVAVP